MVIVNWLYVIDNYPMCIAAPGKVISIKKSVASILYPGVQGRTAIITDIKPKIGDYVLVQMGIITKILTPKEAKESTKAWEETINSH